MSSDFVCVCFTVVTHDVAVVAGGSGAVQTLVSLVGISEGMEADQSFARQCRRKLQLAI